MKLYGEAMPAPNPRRVRIFLAEKGVEVPEIRIGMRLEPVFCDVAAAGITLLRYRPAR